MVKQAARLCPQLLSKIHDPVDLSKPIVVGLGADSLLYPVPEVIKLGRNWNPKVDKSKGTLHARCIVCPLVQFWRNTTIQFSGKVSLVWYQFWVAQTVHCILWHLILVVAQGSEPVFRVDVDNAYYPIT